MADLFVDIWFHRYENNKDIEGRCAFSYLHIDLLNC